jgi:hypothetical protein
VRNPWQTPRSRCRGCRPGRSGKNSHSSCLAGSAPLLSFPERAERAVLAAWKIKALLMWAAHVALATARSCRATAQRKRNSSLISLVRQRHLDTVPPTNYLPDSNSHRDHRIRTAAASPKTEGCPLLRPDVDASTHAPSCALDGCARTFFPGSISIEPLNPPQSIRPHQKLNSALGRSTGRIGSADARHQSTSDFPSLAGSLLQSDADCIDYDNRSPFLVFSSSLRLWCSVSSSNARKCRLDADFLIMCRV